MPRESKAFKKKSPEQPAAVWKEREILDGKPVDAGVIILRTSGCSHFHKGGCSMCGYNYESDRSIGPGDIIKQFDHATKDLGDLQFLKVYTSGSFLDECEVPMEVADHVLNLTAERGQRLLFESRPEFVNEQVLQRAASVNEDLEIALGLESSNDRVLKYSINKGFAREDYESAARRIVSAGIALRTYVLLKPPFLTEAEAIADSKETIVCASKFSRTISLNPVNVQKGTHVERLWRNWAYRPPWLWSVLEVLKDSDSGKARLVCEPTGGGRERGAHNCGRCDDTILASVKTFSESQDRGRLGSPECDCREVWNAVKHLDGFVMGGTADLQRFFKPHRN